MPVTLPLRLYAHIETIASQDPAVHAEINARHIVPPMDVFSGIKPAANLTEAGRLHALNHQSRAIVETGFDDFMRQGDRAQ